MSDYLDTAHFADPINVRLFDYIKRRIEAGEYLDAVTLYRDLERSGELDEIGGTFYLAGFLGCVRGPTEALAQAIRDLWIRRQLIQVAELIMSETIELFDLMWQVITAPSGRKNPRNASGVSLREGAPGP